MVWYFPLSPSVPTHSTRPTHNTLTHRPRPLQQASHNPTTKADLNTTGRSGANVDCCFATLRFNQHHPNTPSPTPRHTFNTKARRPTPTTYAIYTYSVTLRHLVIAALACVGVVWGRADQLLAPGYAYPAPPSPHYHHPAPAYPTHEHSLFSYAYFSLSSLHFFLCACTSNLPFASFFSAPSFNTSSSLIPPHLPLPPAALVEGNDVQVLTLSTTNFRLYFFPFVIFCPTSSTSLLPFSPPLLRNYSSPLIIIFPNLFLLSQYHSHPPPSSPTLFLLLHLLTLFLFLLLHLFLLFLILLLLLQNKGMPYDFAYGVKDDYTGNNYGHNENSDGNTVTGEYSVLLPDGRTQIVTYTADHHTGYVAKVSFEGEATYPALAPYPLYGAP
ncbi:Adult-specific cuticular protein ACP-20-like 2 [Homarus americanus]|uniref:Adult-specific cuticular protein ACP-20-like 2 n=1 Tax=Homarus americanus TaxID=6706 RepID=A0A8J5JMZ8_HOMAM|nr:Adult-specific cuticular protein ACP-20-like 2 [Homarus americanus]